MLPCASVWRQCSHPHSRLGETSARKEQTVPFTLANSQALLGGHQPASASPGMGTWKEWVTSRARLCQTSPCRDLLWCKAFKCSKTFWLTLRVASTPLFLACTRTDGPERGGSPTLSACRGHPQNPAIKVAPHWWMKAQSTLSHSQERKGTGARWVFDMCGQLQHPQG